MSWQVASFAVLGLVLLAGFAWYERSKPPSQVVAVVAALAALAVAGRIAFAAVPNVVATTDIVLFAGFVFGAAPGFAVGALAGLVSNFWLGQGPWTPWQMAAWGLCGIAGALLGRATGREVGRIWLATACAAAAIAFGGIMNFSLMVTYGGEATLERFLALESRALPFDFAHAAGNVALALVAGPMMIRMLIRYRERFEWRRGGLPGAKLRARPALTTLLLSVCLAGAAAAPAAATPDEASAWLAAQQNSDGGFSASPGEESGVEMTGWAMLGLEAAGRNPLDVREGGSSPVRFLRRNISEVTSTGDLARTILALSGAKLDPQDFAGRDLVKALSKRRRKDGSYGGQVNLTAFAVMAQRAAGKAAVSKSLRWLRDVQNPDGGWGFTRGVASEADSTGAALQAVRGSRSSRRGASWLIREQTSAGGWRIAGTGAVNAQSTAWALQGLIAAGRNPERVRTGGRSGVDYLLARQSDDGHIAYSSSTDQTPVWVTSQALVPLFGQAYPVKPVGRRPRENDRNGSGDGDGDGTGGNGGGGGGGGSGGGGVDTGGSGGGGGGSVTPADPGPASAGGDGSGSAGGGGAGTGGDTPTSSDSADGGTAAPQGGGAGVAEAEEPLGETAEDDTVTEEAELAGDEVVTARDREDENDPLVPLGVGLGTAAVVGFGVWWLARRNGW